MKEIYFNSKNNGMDIYGFYIEDGDLFLIIDNKEGESIVCIKDKDKQEIIDFLSESGD